MNIKVEKIVKETDESVSIHFKNPGLFQKLKYKPGQFLTISVPVNGKHERRAYSFSSSPFTDKLHAITVKKVKNGLVSNYINNTLKEGDTLEVEKPTGGFFVEPDKSKKRAFVMFSGGSGITPMFSITKSLLEKEPQTTILLIYANRDIKGIIFHDDLKELQEKYPDRFHVEHVVEYCKDCKNNYHTGLLTKGLTEVIMLKHEYLFSECEFLLCGPGGYMEMVKKILAEHKVYPNKIKMEAFTIPTVKINFDKLVSNVTIKQKGSTNTITIPADKSILQGALAQNVLIPYSCRSGMCSTCKARCVTGEIEMLNGHLLPEKDVKEGFILTCVSYPKSKNVEIEILA